MGSRKPNAAMTELLKDFDKMSKFEKTVAEIRVAKAIELEKAKTVAITPGLDRETIRSMNAANKDHKAEADRLMPVRVRGRHNPGDNANGYWMDKQPKSTDSTDAEGEAPTKEQTPNSVPAKPTVAASTVPHLEQKRIADATHKQRLEVASKRQQDMMNIFAAVAPSPTSAASPKPFANWGTRSKRA